MTRIWVINTDKKVNKIRFNPSDQCCSRSIIKVSIC